MLLRDGLEQTATGALRRMASAHGLPVDDGTTRSELVDRLTERLADATYLGEQLRGLSDAQRAILSDARANHGELRGLLVERDHPAEADEMVDRGLLFRVFSAAGPRRGEVFAAPDELLALVPEPPPGEPPPPAEEAPAERRSTDPAFSLFCVASALLRHGSDLEAEVRAWSVEPGDRDGSLATWDARWTFIRHVAQGAGLLVHQADGALVPGPSLVRGLDDPAAIADRLWRAYARDRTWSDLSEALSHAGGSEAPSIDAPLADAVLLRAALVEALDALPEGEWLRIEAISDWLERTRPALVREQLSARGLLAFEASGWTQLELPLVRYVLCGPLYWLGRVALSADGTRVSRRSAQQPAHDPCSWEQHDLLAPARAELGQLLQTERYLILRERGRVSRYELVQAHVAASLASGGSIADCRRLLERLTRSALPPPIDERLAAWQSRFGALSVRPAVLLEARAQADLDAALAEDDVRRLVRARLGPTAVEVAAADALELGAVLRQRGHLPQIDAALRLSADPRRAYSGLIDEQVLEWVLICLLAFRDARPEQLAELEGSSSLLERLERQFPPERLRTLRASAARLAGELRPTPKRRSPRARARAANSTERRRTR